MPTKFKQVWSKIHPFYHLEYFTTTSLFRIQCFYTDTFHDNKCNLLYTQICVFTAAYLVIHIRLVAGVLVLCHYFLILKWMLLIIWLFYYRTTHSIYLVHDFSGDIVFFKILLNLGFIVLLVINNPFYFFIFLQKCSDKFRNI